AGVRALAVPARPTGGAHHRPGHERHRRHVRRAVPRPHGVAAILPGVVGRARALFRCAARRPRMTGRWRDISIALGPGTPEWPGDTPYSCRWTQQLARGDTVNLSAVTTSPHVGTHADAPLHVHDGWPTSDDLPLEVFAGPATVCSFERVDALPRTPLERLLLRTGSSTADGAFPAEWPALSVRQVESLLERG